MERGLEFLLFAIDESKRSWLVRPIGAFYFGADRRYDSYPVLDLSIFASFSVVLSWQS